MAKKKPKKTVSVRLDPDHIDKAKRMAATEERTFSAVISRLIEKGLDAEKKENACQKKQ